jgi:hypothetical protein
MSDRTLYRLRDIIAAVEHIDRLLHAKSFHDVQSDPFTRAAFERFLEIISEASRHIPDEMKASSPETQWRRIGDIASMPRYSGDCTRTESFAHSSQSSGSSSSPLKFRLQRRER